MKKQTFSLAFHMITSFTFKEKYFLFFVACLQFPSVCWGQKADLHQSRVVTLDLEKMVRTLSVAPHEHSINGHSTPLNLSLPMIKGPDRSFNIVESPIMHQDLAAKYPAFKTYLIREWQNPSISGRITITPYGFNALIFSPEGIIHFKPLDLKNPGLHQVRLVTKIDDILSCTTNDPIQIPELNQNIQQSFSNGLYKKNFNLAIVATGEFFQGNGGNMGAATAVLMSAVSGITAIFERELSVGFQLLPPVIYTDPATDPFVSTGDITELAASVIAANFNNGAYDLGHVFHDTDQGNELTQAGAGATFAVCDDTQFGTGYRKGGGWSGYDDNTHFGFVNLAAHEFGHMFGMPHTMNGNAGGCFGEVEPESGYEIGSGSTIMAYNGVCEHENIPNSGTADDYFHASSLETAITFINTLSCQNETLSGNTPPTVNANPCGGSYSIPVSTPFRLTGSGSDANGDEIYFCWEQFDEDGVGTPTAGYLGSQAAASTIAPLFRSYPPTTSPTRYFPHKSLITTNEYASDFEALPTVARTLNFRLTGRDFYTGSGGIHSSDLSINVSSAGPLSVVSPNGGESLSSGNSVSVTWSVNGVNTICDFVNIRLSVDGGLTYPYFLIKNTLNDGIQNVIIPNGVQNSNQCRVMVESACNTCVVFFDISDNNFIINSVCLASGNIVDPIAPLVLPQDDPGLNLSMQPTFGTITTQLGVTINNASQTGPAVSATEEGGNICQTLNGWPNQKYETFDFIPSQAGAYKLNIDFPPDGDDVSVFVANGYNGAQPCNTTFLGSNTFGQEAYTDNFLIVNLTAGVKYKAVIWSLGDANGTATITFEGPGNILDPNSGPGINYGFTYLAINTTTDLIEKVSASADFTDLEPGSYKIYGASYHSGNGPIPPTVNPANWIGNTQSQTLTNGDCVVFSTNYRSITVTGGGGSCIPPAISSVGITHPTCQSMGTLEVFASGQGSLEYSIDGLTWQTDNTFNSLAPGNYNVIVRILGDVNCSTPYAQNPLTLAEPMDCGSNCTDYTQTNLNLHIPDNSTTGVQSIINVPSGGVITDVNIKNLNGTHTYIGALVFSLQSPQGKMVTLINNACYENGGIDFNVSLDDQAVNGLSCPYNAGNTEQPENSLSAFNGENPMGNWILIVADTDAYNDVGALNGWTLEICVQGGGVNCPPNKSVNDIPIANGTYQASISLSSMGTVGAGNSVIFKAGNNIELLPNFAVPATAVLEIKIEGCN